MREPERINRILELLEQVWKKHPDWRLGQLLNNVSQEYITRGVDIFFWEDNETEKGLLRLLKKEPGQKRIN